MRLELICTGSELIDGRRIDTTTKLLANLFREEGLNVFRVTLVGDRDADIAKALRSSLSQAEIVIVSGGLGPTVDDRTRYAAAEVFRRELVEDADALRELEEKFALFNRPMMDNNRRQCLVPTGARILANPIGTANGFALEEGGKWTIFAPGVPRELELMAREQIIPLIHEQFALKGQVSRVTLKTFGKTESAVDKLLADVELGDVELAFTASFPEIHLTLTAIGASKTIAERKRNKVRALIRRRLEEAIFTEDEREMEEVVGELLNKHGLKVATAESCTGGMVAARLTNVPGSSNYFIEGAVTYRNEAKLSRLGVSEELLAQYGAVSEQVAQAMAVGMRESSGADLAISVTGIAGPEGGTPEKPVGTVFMALASPQGVRTWHDTFRFGDRWRVRTLSAATALNRLRKFLLKWPS